MISDGFFPKGCHSTQLVTVPQKKGIIPQDLCHFSKREP